MQNNANFTNITGELNPHSLPFTDHVFYMPNTNTKLYTNMHNTVTTPNTSALHATVNIPVNAPVNTYGNGSTGILNYETDSIFNKTCNEVSNRLIGETNLTNKNNLLSKNNVVVTEHVDFNGKNLENNQFGTSRNLNNIIQNETNISTITMPLKSQYYTLFGHEFSLWMLILALLILITIIYFLYKWFSSSDTQIVTINKSKELIQLTDSKDNDNLNNEISDSDNSNSDSDSESGVSKIHSKKEDKKETKNPQINKKNHSNKKE